MSDVIMGRIGMDVMEGIVVNEEAMASPAASAAAQPQPEKLKPYLFRRLNASDLFLMIKIINKMSLKEFAACLQSPQVMRLAQSLLTEKDSENTNNDKELIVGVGVAMEILDKLMYHLPSCQSEIYELLSNVSGIPESEIAVMDAEIFMDMLVDFIKKEEFAGFLKAALRLIK